MFDIETHRHEKETLYYRVAFVLGALSWLGLIVTTLGLVLVYVLILGIGLYFAQQFFHAQIQGNAVKVSADQYPKVFKMLTKHCKTLSIDQIPNTYVVNGGGIINAFAVKFLSKKYVILYSDLVDLMLKRNQLNELSMVVAHELAHHAAGHTQLSKNFVIAPAKFLPFLGKAYSRACEFTCDRIGAVLTDDHEASQRALINITSGCETLGSEVNIAAFQKQEAEVPPFFGFLAEIFSTHPRMTRRVLELEKHKPKASIEHSGF